MYFVNMQNADVNMILLFFVQVNLFLIKLTHLFFLYCIPDVNSLFSANNLVTWCWWWLIAAVALGRVGSDIVLSIGLLPSRDVYGT